MKSLVCAVTCTMSESGEIQLDPTLEQEKVRKEGRVELTQYQSPSAGIYLTDFM